MIECSHRNRARGAVLIWSIVTLVALLGFASLAVDVAHLRLAKAQLSTAADAAARYGAMGISENPVSNAIVAAQDNLVDGTALTLSSSDVSVGYWDTNSRSFDPNGSPMNAVRVTAVRSAARGNAVPLLFAPIIGRSGFDLQATSIAYIRQLPARYPFVGINGIRIAPLTGVVNIVGSLASNGNITIGALTAVSVNGDVQSFSGSVSTGIPSHISGTTSPLSQALSYPPAVAPTINDNLRIFNYLDLGNNCTISGHALLPSGTYVVNNLTFAAGSTINMQGPVKFYVTGTLTVGAAFNLLGMPSTSASNLSAYVKPGGTVNLNASLGSLYMYLYAPNSTVQIPLGTTFHGNIIAAQLSLLVTGSLYNDPALTTGATSVAIVR